MKLRLLFVSLFAVALAVGATGCGDDNDGGGGVFSCGQSFQACGGDPTGTWSSTAVCNPEVEFTNDCSAADVNITANRSSATADFGSDGNYSRNETVDYDYIVSAPTECLEGLSCAQIAGVIGATCEDTATGCNCTGTANDTVVSSGTWEVVGNNIVMDIGTDEEAQIAFCIDGNGGYTQNDEGLRIIWRK